MRKLLGLCLLLLFSCTENNDSSFSSNDLQSADSAKMKSGSLDDTLKNLSLILLSSIKNKDYKTIGDYVHPVDGIRFSPYGYIDSADLKFDRAAFITSANSNDKFIWGTYAGSGEPIQLTFSEYFSEFLYDANFLQPEKFSIDTLSSHSNYPYSFQDFYHNTHFTESYFSGFDEKYEGMDWRSLILVMRKFKDRFYVCGILHDEWTP
jgi:hypothetical protein